MVTCKQWSTISGIMDNKYFSDMIILLALFVFTWNEKSALAQGQPQECFPLKLKTVFSLRTEWGSVKGSGTSVV